MQHKELPLTGIKTADLPEGVFDGWAAAFDNVDHHNDVIRRGAFAAALKSGQVTPILWLHKADDPRNFVGEVIEAEETAEGLKIRGRFDMDTEHGAAAYRAVKSRRVTGLSIGYAVRNATKNANGVNELLDVDLIEVSVVTRPANDRALITAAKSADRREHLRERVARAQLQTRTNEGQTMPFYEPTDLSNEFDRVIAKALAPPPAQVKAATDQFTKDRDSQLAAAREIVELAKELERDLTDKEAEKVQKHLDAAEQATKALADAERSKSLLAQLDAMAAKDVTFNHVTGEHVYGEPGAAAEAGKRLAFTKGMAGKMATKILGDGIGAKAVAPSGSAVVMQEFDPDPVALGRPANSLLAVLPVKGHGQPEFSYLRQSVRTNAAAIVPEGTTKPTSVYSVVRVEDKLEVVAHLSEPVPRYWFTDSETLQQFLEAELSYGLELAVEAMALTDIAGTSGIQVNAFATSPLVTLRKSLTKLEANGYDPAAMVLHPNDWEAVELLVSSTNAIEHMSLPYDPASRRLYGVPVVITNVQTEGVAHTLAAGAASLDTDGQGVLVQWSETSNATDFAENKVRARCEGRFATSVYSPLGVVQSDLTQA